MIRLVLWTVFLQIIKYILLEDEMAIPLSAGFLVPGLIVLIFLTERHLKMKGFK